ITILGMDEADTVHHHISWVAPVAQALLKAREGDTVRLRTPNGWEPLEVLDVRYPAPVR
ncbi:MAG: GreA/GreB family elongation factor, partial [Macromonas sp.]